MAATLMDANQNSNSPKLRTEIRLVMVKITISNKANTHEGTSGNQYCNSIAPATASSATTITQKYQYIQPVKKPAKFPRASRLYS